MCARPGSESYVGTWLPEPIVSDLHESPEQMAELSESLSMALLVLLESLTRWSELCSCYARFSIIPTGKSPRS